MWLEETANTTLYHYTKGYQGETFLIDPAKTTPQSYSRRDYMAFSESRTFFYLNPEDREPYVGKFLYEANYSKGLIYDLIKDPMNLKDKSGYNGANIGDYLETVHKELIETGKFDGWYYKPPQGPIVNLFVPVLGKFVKDISAAA